MSDPAMRFAGDGRNPIVYYLGIALLIGVVLLLAWLQFEWLTELRKEEEARRRVALHVAATNYAEYIDQEINLLLEKVNQAGVMTALTGSAPLLDTVVELDADGSARFSAVRGSGYLPATRAQVQQWLGRPLIQALANGQSSSNALFWLDPPAIVYCPDRCQIGVLDTGQLGASMLAPAARRMFADFGAELRTAVMIAGSGKRTLLYPANARPALVSVTDLEQPLLTGVPVLGPAGARWALKVNHGGSSLETAVAASHLRNLLLSSGLFGVLVLSIGLVVFNARRQLGLAREHLYFAAGVSHDLRTPLSVISSAADNLADCTVSEDRRVHEYGELIQREVRRLKDTIENVLQFTQSASATRPRLSGDVDMAAVIRQVLDSCAALLEEWQLRLEVPDSLPTVRGDPAALRSALTNLVVNAARHASGGDWIRISATTVRVRPRGRALRISISNPVASPPDVHAEKLFEPFYRGQQARAAGVGGTGIGLAVARNVAQQHGGGVSVDAAQRGVIKFTLFLPIHEPERTTHSAG
jgi:signal transduction histidine kinase